ncbi:MAG: hypothetical protein ACRDMX_18100 [Solirubrobacteraceae bacterium]
MDDPLQDPRAADLLAAHPDEVATLAANFQAAADESAMTATGLRAAQQDGIWTGRAANAFRGAIGQLPGQLSQVQAGYAAVSDALRAYEPELASIQSSFAALLAHRAQLTAQLTAAETISADAHQAVAAAAAQGPSGRPGVAASAELAIAGADRSIGAYRGEIDALNARGYALLDEFAATRDSCRAAVAAAQRTAPVRPIQGMGEVVIS